MHDTFRAIIRGPKDADELGTGIVRHLTRGYTYIVEGRTGLTGDSKFWIVEIRPTESIVVSDLDELLEEWQSASDEIQPPAAQLIWFERIPAQHPKYDAAVAALKMVTPSSAATIVDAILAAVREDELGRR